MIARRVVVAALIAAAALPLSAQSAGTALLRVVHAAPDAPAVDVLAGTTPLFVGLPYRQFTGYIEVPAGNYVVNIRAAGGSTNVFSKPFTLPAGAAVTVYAVGNLTQSSTSRPFDLVAAVDDRTAPNAGQAKVRAVHAAPAAPNVDVFVTAPYVPLMGVAPAVGLNFGSASPVVTVPAGLYQGRLAPVGTMNVVASTGSVRLASGTINTIIALNPATANGPVEFLVITE